MKCKPILSILLLIFSFTIYSQQITETYFTNEDYIRDPRLQAIDRSNNSNFIFSEGFEIITLEDGFRVNIQNEKVGVTPYEQNCSIGTYRVILSKNLYEPIEILINVQRGKRTRIEITNDYLSSQLKIIGLYENSKVYINNVLQEDDISITYGQSVLKIETFGYETFRQVINITNSDPYIIEYEPIAVDFKIDKMNVSLNYLNPNPPGINNNLKIWGSISRPSTLLLEILDIDRSIIFSDEKKFDNQDFTFYWDCSSLSSENYGDYLVRVTLIDADISKTENIIIGNKYRAASDLFSVANNAVTIPPVQGIISTKTTPIFANSYLDMFLQNIDIYYSPFNGFEAGTIIDFTFFMDNRDHRMDAQLFAKYNIINSGPFSFTTLLTGGLSTTFVSAPDKFLLSLSLPLELNFRNFSFLLDSTLYFSPDFILSFTPAVAIHFNLFDIAIESEIPIDLLNGKLSTITISSFVKFYIPDTRFAVSIGGDLLISQDYFAGGPSLNLMLLY